MPLRKYGVSTTLYFRVIKRGVVDFAVSGDWTPASGDCKISKDGGAQANTTNLPAIVAGTLWKLVLTATEMQAAEVNVDIVDSATKAIEDQGLTVETYGHASAEHVFDLGTAKPAVTLASGDVTGNLPANVTQLLGTAWLAPSVAGTPDVNAKLIGGTAQTGRDVGASVLVGDKTGFSLANGSFVTATFGTCDFTATMKTSLNAATPAVTVSDKTGFSISGTTTTLDALQTALNSAHGAGSWATATGFSTHSASDVWAVGTRTLSAFAFSVTVGTNNDKTGYSLTQTFPANFAALLINASGHVSRVTLADTVTTNTDMLTAAAVRDVSNSSPAAGSLGEAARNADAKAAVIIGTIGTPATTTVSADVAAVKADTAATLDDTGTAGVVVATGSKTGYALTSAYDFAKGTVAMAESYAANGSAPTPVQAFFAVHQALTMFAYAGTAWNVYKLDGTTLAFAATLDDAANPAGAKRL